MYFEDLSPYTYLKNSDCLLKLEHPESDEEYNIGWLDKEHVFPQGNVASELLSKILYLCTLKICQTRGFHNCPFCSDKADFREEMGECIPAIEYCNKEYYLGSAEIRVIGKNGKIYAAPNMIYHYIQKHNYLPPQEFLDALADVQIPPPQFVESTPMPKNDNSKSNCVMEYLSHLLARLRTGKR